MPVRFVCVCGGFFVVVVVVLGGLSTCHTWVLSDLNQREARKFRFLHPLCRITVSLLFKNKKVFSPKIRTLF